MDAGSQIAAAMSDIERYAEEDRYRQQFRAALKVLREIPSGTPDNELTPEQREAWKSYDQARDWFGSTVMRGP